MNIYIYIDESGVLHKNATDTKFVYAGLVFFKQQEKNRVSSRFKKLEKQISKHYCGELKANKILPKHKKSLFNVIKNEKRFIIDISIDKMYNSILEDKRSIQRFKDYTLARTIKEMLHIIKYQRMKT